MGISYNPRIITNGLVGYWDAGNAKSYPGSGATWYDLSGNGNHGTLINSPTHDGKSFTFNSASSQRVSIPYKSEWRMIGSNTVEYWSKENSGQNGCVVAYAKGGWEGYNFLGEAVYYSGAAGSNELSASTGKVSGQWAMITIVFDRSANYYYVYRDGNLINSIVITQPDLSSYFTSGELTLGGNGTFAGRYYTGSISAVKFYTIALSPQEVKQNFNALRGRYGI